MKEKKQQTGITATDYPGEATAIEDEQFEDASDVPADRICPICNEQFNASEPEELFISHVEDHVVKVCPVCTQEFLPDDDSYVRHVNICLVSNEHRQQQQEQEQEYQYPQLGTDIPPGSQFV